MSAPYDPEQTRQLALALGPTWTGRVLSWEDGRTRCSRLTCGEAVVECVLHAHTKRVVVSGEFPRSPRGNLYGGTNGSHAITVSPDRTPAAVASEIRRRLLPDYVPALTSYLALRAETERQRGAAAALAEDLIARSGGRLERSRNGRTDGTEVALYARTVGATYLDLRVYSDGVRLDHGSLSADLARRLAELLVVS